MPIAAPCDANASSPEVCLSPAENGSQTSPAAESNSAAEPSVNTAEPSVTTAEPSGGAAKPSGAAEPGAEPKHHAPKDQTPKAGDGRVRFRDLKLTELVQAAVEKAGYEYPTEVQSRIIPQLLAGRDVLAQSQTGTGKTAAFALPILSRLDTEQRVPQVLVLAPTRELAIQVAKSFSTYAADLPDFRVAAIYGGQDYEPQLKQLRRGVDVVVGTPGRVIDHVKRGTLELGQLRCLVLDEADEMLNMGFLEDVQFVLEQTPPGRQVALFSATLPEPIRRIAETYLSDPAKVTVARKTMTAESIRQRAVFVPPREKLDALRRFLEMETTDGVIVFTKTKEATVTVAEQLQRDGFHAVALNGDMPQKTRERTIGQLRAGRLDVLVATDVAARGLDVPRISHVFNFDLPHDSESYVHRIGRTGRAGRSGEAIIFLTNAQRGKLRLIERATKQKIEVVSVPTADQINEARIASFHRRITKELAGADLTLFESLVNTYLAENEAAPEHVAAAIASIAQKGRPFLMPPDRSRPKRESPASKRNRSDRDDDNHFDSPSRRGKDKSAAFSRQGGQSKRRSAGPPQAGMTRYRVEVGHRDGVKPGNLVGAIANEAGLSGPDIGPIQIQHSFSTVDLPEGMPPDIRSVLTNTWVSGKKLAISEWNGDGRPARFGKSPRGGNSHGGNSHGGKPRGRKAPHARGSGGPESPPAKKKSRKGKRERLAAKRH